MKNLLIKYKPQLYYVLFGTITTIIDVGLYWLLCSVFDMPTILSYSIAWFISVAFSFITNKIWVYGSRSMRFKVLLKEGLAYYSGRAISYVAGYIVILLCEMLTGMGELFQKIISDIVVTIINYGFGFFVFKRLEEDTDNI